MREHEAFRADTIVVAGDVFGCRVEALELMVERMRRSLLLREHEQQREEQMGEKTALRGHAKSLPQTQVGWQMANGIFGPASGSRSAPPRFDVITDERGQRPGQRSAPPDTFRTSPVQRHAVAFKPESLGASASSSPGAREWERTSAGLAVKVMTMSNDRGEGWPMNF